MESSRTMRASLLYSVPRSGWKPFFARVGNQRETRVSRGFSAGPPPIRFSYRGLVLIPSAGGRRTVYPNP